MSGRRTAESSTPSMILLRRAMRRMFPWGRVAVITCRVASAGFVCAGAPGDPRRLPRRGRGEGLEAGRPDASAYDDLVAQATRPSRGRPGRAGGGTVVSGQVRVRDGGRAAPTAEALLGLGEAVWWLGDVAESSAAERAPTRSSAAVRSRSGGGRRGPPQPHLPRKPRQPRRLGRVAGARGAPVDEFELAPLAGWVALIRAGGAPTRPRPSDWPARRSRAPAGSPTPTWSCAPSASSPPPSSRWAGSRRGSSCWTRRWPAHSVARGQPNTVVFTSCQMMISCSRAAEYERAGEWIRAADDFTGRYGCPFLYTVCRTLYGGCCLHGPLGAGRGGAHGRPEDVDARPAHIPR